MIRKTILLVTGTVAGVVGVVGYNPPQLDAAISPTGSSPAPVASETTSATPAQSKSPSPTAKSQPQAKPTKSVGTATPTESKSNNSTQSSAPTPAPEKTTPAKSNGASGVFQGDTSYTRWGPVQVEITLADGKITNVSTLQYPNGDRRSLNISNQVLPWLQQEVLRSQSANITGISGATYTSNGFKTSLASALQKAGI